ncbi:hypothetical protein KCP70_22935 [Salmonella enterica subsp. enterica]|nr:hypothetical protein KCP70_22935 [Salmonella enterica subsp. enterica]
MGGRLSGVVPAVIDARVDSRNVGVTPACCSRHCHPPTGSPPGYLLPPSCCTAKYHSRCFNVAGNARLLSVITQTLANGSGGRCLTDTHAITYSPHMQPPLPIQDTSKCGICRVRRMRSLAQRVCQRHATVPALLSIDRKRRYRNERDAPLGAV